MHRIDERHYKTAPKLNTVLVESACTLLGLRITIETPAQPRAKRRLVHIYDRNTKARGSFLLSTSKSTLNTPFIRALKKYINEHDTEEEHTYNRNIRAIAKAEDKEYLVTNDENYNNPRTLAQYYESRDELHRRNKRTQAPDTPEVQGLQEGKVTVNQS